MKNILKILTLVSLISVLFAQKGVFVGGGLSDNNTEIWRAFISLSSPNNKVPYIGVVTAASDTPGDNGDFYLNLLKGTYGVDNLYWIPIDENHTAEAFAQKHIDEVNKMTGIFFGGGDQSRLTKCFYFKNGSGSHQVTPLLQAILSRHSSGDLVVSGSSAGTTIQQGTPMVTGGESWDALEYGAFPNIQQDAPDDLTYDERGGFNIFPFGYLDTHFATRGRQGRMWKLLWSLRNKTAARGWGIDEDTALIVDGNIGTVIGNTGVYYMDLTTAQAVNDNGLDNIRISYLTEGDTFDFRENTINFAPWKEGIEGKETNKLPFEPSTDIFDSYRDRDAPGETFTNITTNLINSYATTSTHAYSWETNPEFSVEFHKGVNTTKGYFGTLVGKQFISYTNLVAKYYMSNVQIPRGNQTREKPFQKKFLEK